MEIFKKIGDAASETYKMTAEKTSKLAKETKLKMQINEYKKQIDDIYKNIGEAVYQKHVLGEEISIKDIEQNCEEIDTLTEKIATSKEEILNLKEKRQCKNCYEEIEIDAHYCPNCGFEQEEIVKIEKTKEIEKEDEEDE